LPHVTHKFPHNFRQSGLHSECCEIDHKLHAIIAGRKRVVLQSIQEETAVNIYFPSPLQGLVGPDISASNAAANGTPTRQDNNVIWITGEFFGVQRARDMLFQVSVTKVSHFLQPQRNMVVDNLADQVSYFAGHSHCTTQTGLDGNGSRRRLEVHYER
jgi:hypothetical protein